MIPAGPIRKIAVLRANSIGDFIFVLPALDALEARFPSAEIVLLAKQWHRDFLADRPGPVDRVVVVPNARGVSVGEGEPDDEPALEDFFRAMRAERFDLAFQLHGGGRWTNPFVRQLGARRTFGLRSRDAEPLDEAIPYIYYQPEVFRYLEVVALAGAQSVGWEPRLSVTPADRKAARRLLPPGRPVAVMHPGASDERRRWPVSHFAEVGEALARAGANVVVIGAGDERNLVEELRQKMRAPFTDLVGRVSLSGLLGLLDASSLLVANDSGPMHLARAVGVPTVGIFWCGNLITAGPTDRARHRPQLSWQLACPECGIDNTVFRCEHRASFVANVGVDDVIRDALELLEEARVCTTGPRPLDDRVSRQPVHGSV